MAERPLLQIVPAVNRCDHDPVGVLHHERVRCGRSIVHGGGKRRVIGTQNRARAYAFESIALETGNLYLHVALSAGDDLATPDVRIVIVRMFAFDQLMRDVTLRIRCFSVDDSKLLGRG